MDDDELFTLGDDELLALGEDDPWAAPERDGELDWGLDDAELDDE